MGSVIFADAARQWRACRQDYDLHLEAQYAAASAATAGHLVNRAGVTKGVTSWSLFTGSSRRAELYASDELLEFWQKHPRMTFQEYERQWWESGE